ncbi:unnamed protein product, partial [marine sediment metagenome]
MASAFEQYVADQTAASYQTVHGTSAPASAIPVDVAPTAPPPPPPPPPPVYAPGDKFYLSPEQQQTITEAYGVGTPPSPPAIDLGVPAIDPLSQTTVPRAPEFTAGMDVTQASDAELWTPIVKGAPGFSGSGVSGETFHQSVVEMAKRQEIAARERQRTGEIDVSVESSGGAFVEAGVVGPAQYLPENTPKAVVEQLRAKEAYEAASIPRARVEGQTYYKPPEFKTVEAWDEALKETFDPAKFVPPPTEPERPALTETVPSGVNIDQSVYEWAISHDYGVDEATKLATIDEVIPENIELPRTEAPYSDEYFRQSGLAIQRAYAEAPETAIELRPIGVNETAESVERAQRDFVNRVVDRAEQYGEDVDAARTRAEEWVDEVNRRVEEIRSEPD